MRSFKHPEEVVSLRRIYGPALVVVAAYSPPSLRLQKLSGRMAESEHEFHSKNFLPQAQQVMKRDEEEPRNRFGQNVRKVFPKADFFVDVSDGEKLRSSIQRIIGLLFGNVFYTPTRDEYGMFHAQAAALRSASLQRQVGAVVMTEGGDIIAVGANEVAKAGGGLYWEGDSPDHRDFVLGYETNDQLKRRMLADVLHRLQKRRWLAESLANEDVDSLVEQVASSREMKEAQVMNVIEFGRCVHAEMAALVDAARRGVAVTGSTLFSTTFPCHECARHIVAAGIRRVVYIEPYPKSLVPELYPDSIAIEPAMRQNPQLSFEPFVGVAPRRYMDLFSMGDIERKDQSGRVNRWDPTVALPRLGEYPSRTGLINAVTEPKAFEEFVEELSTAGILRANDATNSE